MAVERRRNFRRRLKYYYHRLFPRHERSLSVAISVFLGVFIGVLPTLGIALVLTAIAAQLAGVPKGPGLLASFIAVPPTLFFFFYPLGYFGVGLPLVQPPAVSFDFLEQVSGMSLFTVGEVLTRLWTHARGHVLAFLVGMLVVAAASGLIAFAATYFVMEQKRKLRAARRRARAQ
jgi:uncharacterized protein (DUF2062 family)